MSLFTNAKKLIGYLLGYEQEIGHWDWKLRRCEEWCAWYQQHYIRFLKGYPPPSETGIITFNEIHEVLMQVGMPRLVLVPDRICKTASVKEYEWVLSLDRLDKAQYEREFFDCDDFAWALMGRLSIGDWAAYAHGVVWTEVDVETHEELEARGNRRVGGVAAHALNFFIDVNHKLWFIEPQTDQILEPEWVIARQGSYQPVLLYIM